MAEKKAEGICIMSKVQIAKKKTEEAVQLLRLERVERWEYINAAVRSVINRFNAQCADINDLRLFAKKISAGMYLIQSNFGFNMHYMVYVREKLPMDKQEMFKEVFWEEHKKFFPKAKKAEILQAFEPVVAANIPGC